MIIATLKYKIPGLIQERRIQGSNGDDLVHSLLEDKAGNLWFGTKLGNGNKGTRGGVWCYRPSAALSIGSKVFTNFTTKNGLSHNSVFSITIDKFGNLWFGTRGRGLCPCDGKTFTNFRRNE